MTKTPPALERYERKVKVNITIDERIFNESQFEQHITVTGEKPEVDLTIKELENDIKKLKNNGT